MQSEFDHRVCEVGATRLKLRNDLIFTPDSSGGLPFYMVEDRLNSRYFRLGVAEYTFVSLLDGDTTINEALSHLSNVLPDHQLTEADAASHCKWLVEMDLAHSAGSSQSSRLAESAQTTYEKKAAEKWNPLMFRIPLGRPDAWFDAMVKPLAWLFSPLAGAAWLLLLTVGGYLIANQWDRFIASPQGMFEASNWLWMALIWVVLKVVHEISHGVVCKMYGGRVRETGVMFMLFAPLAYVDVTSTWSFRSRWRRMHVAAAGMYIELLIAALAAIVWSQTESPWLANICFNIIFMSSLTTLMFNANPLMKFDGYYILSDALDIPNLYTSGQSYLQTWGRRYLFGSPATLPQWGWKNGIIIRVYGWASFGWRTMVCLGMVLTAATLFHGAGIVLAVLAIVLWYGIPAVSLAKYLAVGEAGDQPNRLRFFLTTGSALAAAVLILAFAPWPGVTKAPVVVEYSPHVVVRAASSGFVKKIYVHSGDDVKQGQLLLELENRSLVRELADLDLQIQQSKIRSRQFQQKGELAAEQAEAKKREGLLTQRNEKQLQVDKLTIRAAVAGKAIGRNLAAKLGAWCEEGDEILSIGDEASKELVLSIAQSDVKTFSQRIGKSVSIDLPGRTSWQSTLEKVIPRATKEPPHDSLIAANGGPLAVKPVTDSGDAKFELLAPRFKGVVSLNRTASKQLFSGQRAWVSYRPFHESVGSHLYHAATSWIRQRFEAAGLQSGV